MTEYERKGIGENSSYWYPSYHEQESKKVKHGSISSDQYRQFLDHLGIEPGEEPVDEETDIDIYWEMEGDPMHLQGRIDIYLDGEFAVESERLTKTELEQAVEKHLETETDNYEETDSEVHRMY